MSEKWRKHEKIGGLKNKILEETDNGGKDLMLDVSLEMVPNVEGNESECGLPILKVDAREKFLLNRRNRHEALNAEYKVKENVSPKHSSPMMSPSMAMCGPYQW